MTSLTDVTSRYNLSVDEVRVMIDRSSVLQSLPRLKQLDDVSLAEDDSEDEEAADGNNDTRALEGKQKHFPCCIHSYSIEY
jgi:DNA primase large subunit